jgi:hypothetical protein
MKIKEKVLRKGVDQEKVYRAPATKGHFPIIFNGNSGVYFSY